MDYISTARKMTSSQPDLLHNFKRKWKETE